MSTEDNKSGLATPPGQDSEKVFVTSNVVESQEATRDDTALQRGLTARHISIMTVSSVCNRVKPRLS